MKRVLLIIACFYAVAASGQLINNFKVFHSITEEQAEFIYGSVNAYNMEAGMEYNSSHRRLVMLIGAKLIWLEEIPHYMAEQLGCSREIDSDNDPIHGHFGVHPGGVITRDDDNSVMDIQAYVDDLDSMHIMKVVMKGNTDLLIKLFVWYWETSDVKFDIKKFKKGCLFYENCGSDRISFNWKNSKPNITITKNPIWPIPLPLIAERTK